MIDLVKLSALVFGWMGASMMGIAVAGLFLGGIALSVMWQTFFGGLLLTSVKVWLETYIKQFDNSG